jgi:hypothetical protein
MNPSDPNHSLARILANWHVNPTADPNFRPAVWQRIQQRTRETWATYVRGHLTRWAVVSALAVAVAGWTGHAVAQAKLDASRDRMVVSYLVDLDPRVLAKMHPSD